MGVLSTNPAHDWGFLLNDSDPDGDPLTVVSIGGSPSGDVEITGGGTGITYDGDTFSLGQGGAGIVTDTFTYTVSDGHGHTDTASVTMHVQQMGVDFAALCIPLTLTSPSVTPGQIITVSGTAADPSWPLVIVYDGSDVLGSETSDATNRFFQVNVTIPADATPGNHTLQMFQLGNDVSPVVGCPASITELTVT